MRALLLPALLLLAVVASAQEPAAAAPDGRGSQKIQRIRIEDGGSRIEELRVGGETQSIVVHPKTDVPAYEIQPSDMARSRPQDHRDGLSGSGGRRVWNVLSF